MWSELLKLNSKSHYFWGMKSNDSCMQITCAAEGRAQGGRVALRRRDRTPTARRPARSQRPDGGALRGWRLRVARQCVNFFSQGGALIEGCFSSLQQLRLAQKIWNIFAMGS